MASRHRSSAVRGVADGRGWLATGVSRYGRENSKPGEEGAPVALPARHPEHKTYPTGNQALPPTASQYGYLAGAYLAKTGTRKGCRKGGRGLPDIPRRDASRDSEGREAVALRRLAARARTRAETSQPHLNISDPPARYDREGASRIDSESGSAASRRHRRQARAVIRTEARGSMRRSSRRGRSICSAPSPRVTSRCAGSYQQSSSSSSSSSS